MKKTERTVANLQNVKMRGILKRYRFRKLPRHTYIYCRSRNIARRFLADAEAEGFTFGNGNVLTECDTSDIFALNRDFTISYTGWAAHIMFRNASAGNVIRIDYGKYMSGAKDYVM